MAGLLYYDSAFGGIALTITSIATEGGRDIAVHSPHRGNKHTLNDQGRRIGKCDCEIMFCDEPGKPTFRARYEQFRDFINAGDVSVFTHPLDGSYLARGEAMRVTSDSAKCVMVSVSFLPQDEPDNVFPSGAGVAPLAGLEAVTVAAADVAEQFTVFAIDDDLPDVAVAKVGGWSDRLDRAEAIVSEVLADIGDITGSINDAIDAYDCATDVNRWPLYKALVNLDFAASRAAESLTQTDVSSVIVTVAAPAPLLAICAEIYGADLAVEMADKVAKRNSIANPGRVLVGTKLVMDGVGAA